MDKLKKLPSPEAPASTVRHYLVVIAIIAVVAVAASALPGRARANARPEDHNNTQVAELYELQAAFHAAASYGGDIEAMMQLWADDRSEEHTSELQSHSFISYAVFCLKK